MKKNHIPEFTVHVQFQRGWAAWLAAAVGDERVVATVPIVLTMLNMTHVSKHFIIKQKQKKKENIILTEKIKNISLKN